MENTFKLKNHFRDFEHFCETLVHEVFTRHNMMTQLDKITYIDGMSDVGRRVYIQVGDIEYMIRTWNVYDTDNWVFVDYTLNKLEENGEYTTV